MAFAPSYWKIRESCLLEKFENYKDRSVTISKRGKEAETQTDVDSEIDNLSQLAIPPDTEASKS